MSIKKILIAILALLGYREPSYTLKKKQNEFIIHISLFLLFILYYFLTMFSICESNVITNITFFCWLVSMFITAIDNIKRLVNGMNKYEKLKNPKHPPKRQHNISQATNFIFHNGFYNCILYMEVLFGAFTLIIHLSELHSVCLYMERFLMCFLTVVFLIQSLVHTLVDLFSLEDIEEIGWKNE